jgi:hypothetical protein
MKTLCGSLLQAAALLLAQGCAQPFTAPPRTVTAVAVLPPSNRSGETLLVAGGTFLEEYAFRTEKVTVADALLAETRTFLAKRGYAIVSGEAVETATGGRAPASVADAARIAVRGDLGGNLLYMVIRRWDPVDRATPRAIIVGIEASLIDRSGRVLWRADRPAKPMPTEGAISQGTAYMIAVRAIVAELFGSWEIGRG